MVIAKHIPPGGDTEKELIDITPKRHKCYAKTPIKTSEVGS